MIKICKTNTNSFQDPLFEESTGVFMTFDNGNQISIQWGKGCYGSYRNSNPNPQTSTAEVLITNSSVDGCPIEPMGWCDSDMVALLIFQASNLTWDNIVKKYNDKS
jgi:hypothetical protein|tara:strand:- start:543 stop:860 length:318 start_codon:yes stop_codon:yes gene_type:complete